MPGEYPINILELKAYNIRKFKGIPPTWELIQKVIRKSGLRTQSRFEKVWGICHRMLTQVKSGDKDLPCRYWHIIYDFDKIKTETQKLVEEKRAAAKKVNILVTNKQLLDDLQTTR